MERTPSYLKNLKQESVVQSVINVLTDAMKNKELKPGDKIPPEPELAASMGVARSSVREAIIAIQNFLANRKYFDII